MPRKPSAAHQPVGAEVLDVRRLRAAHWNETAKPFRWTKSARQIKRQIRRVTDIYETGH